MQPARLGALVWCHVPTALLVLLVLAPFGTAQQAVLETPQQVNDRIRAMSASARVMPRDYVIGNGDLLDVEVFDVKELSREVRVSQTGSIGIPLVPVRLHVAGLTEVQAVPGRPARQSSGSLGRGWGPCQRRWRYSDCESAGPGSAVRPHRASGNRPARPRSRNCFQRIDSHRPGAGAPFFHRCGL